MSRYDRHPSNNTSNGLWGGVVVLIIGLVFLLRKMDLHLPHWVFSWPMLLIVIGFVMGAKNKFQGAGWFILTFIGTVFLINDILPWQWQLQRFFWPIILIVIGLFMISRASTRNRRFDEIAADSGNPSASPEDFLQSTTIFSGTNKVILSKNFRGGTVTTIFGGTELNFMQADLNGEVVLEITAMFAGIELIVPSHWDVKLDMNTVFGGIEDKRMVVPASANKILVLKGTCLFGGVDLKSY
jgi:predicted membrane protein